MLEHIILTAVQARILLTMLIQDGMGTSALVKATRVSGSAWSKESKTLAQLGLLTSEEKKVISGKRVRRIKQHKLTSKGFEVAKSIQQISMTLRAPA
jgi:DNA-binding MarR family transcriptional regulator